MRKVVTRLALAMVLGTAAVTLAAGDAHAALNAYLQVKGQKQGTFKGGVTQKGREGWLQVVSFDHKVVSPRDAATGLATGKRQHKPLAVTITVDKAMPLLLGAWASNETLSEVKLPVFQSGGAKGNEVLAYEIKLTNASIASIDFSSTADMTGGKDQIVVSFTYQKIEWTWKAGAITAMDDWTSPVK